MMCYFNKWHFPGGKLIKFPTQRLYLVGILSKAASNSAGNTVMCTPYNVMFNMVLK